MEIRIKYLRDIPKLQSISVGDWIDLYTAEDTFITSGNMVLIPLGIAIELPNGYEAVIAPRSSTFKRYGVIQANGLGIIDNSYCGDNDEWHFPALCVVEATFIPKGIRICQFRLLKNQPKLSFIEVESLGNTNRGGLGSTGE